MFVSIIEPKVWQKTLQGGPHGGHLEIQYDRHLIGRTCTPSPMHSHCNYVCIYNRTKVMEKNVAGGPLHRHLDIQFSGHVMSSPMAPFDWPNQKNLDVATLILFVSEIE
jgi:hypothetical protein